MASILSTRGRENLSGLDIPWRFVPPPAKLYNKTTNHSGLISFATAEHAGPQEELAKYVHENVKIPPEAYMYSFSSSGGPRFPTAMANFLNTQFRPFTPIYASNILTASGVTPIENMLAFSITDPGDGILVPRPIYGRFELDFGNEARAKIVYAEMGDVDAFLDEEGLVRKFEEALKRAKDEGVGIRAVLIANPSNPLGRCYKKGVLRGIMRFCGVRGLHLISDEVFGLTVFETGDNDVIPFTSVLAINAEGLIGKEFVHVLYGMSKDFGAAGLRLGCLVTRSEAVMGACRAVMRFHNPSGPSIAIGTAILEDEKFYTAFLARSRDHLATGYRYITSVLNGAGISYMKGGNAGLFVYADLSPYLPQGFDKLEREYALAQHLVDNGVFLHPGEEHCQLPGWFRICFASLNQEELEEGLRRLTIAL